MEVSANRQRKEKLTNSHRKEKYRCDGRGHNRGLVDTYLATLQRRRYSPKTVQTYRHPLLALLEFLGDVRLQDVRCETIEAWRLSLIERGLAPASLEVFLRAVRLLFGWLEDNGRIFMNPCCSLIIPKHSRPLQPVPSRDDVRRLLARPDVATPLGLRDRALLETAYATGARREELVRMRIFDPNLVSKTIRIHGKGNKQRVLPLGQHAAHWIERYLQFVRPHLAGESIDVESLWLGWGAVSMSGQAMHFQIKRHAVDAGIKTPITLHSLRRACATHMLQNGAHPLQIQMLLGHATMKHLSQYLRLTITEIKAMHQQSKPGR